MSVPLGHKNSRSSRNSRAKFGYEISQDDIERKIVGDAVLSKDGKRFLRLNGKHRANYVLPKTVKEAYSSAFDGSAVKSITLPKGIKSFSCSPKEAWYYFETKKQSHPFLGDVYYLIPKYIIFYDKKLLSDVQGIIARKRIPDNIKPFLLRQLHNFGEEMVDSSGIGYCMGGKFLWSIPKGMKAIDIKEGVTTINQSLLETDIEEVSIPSTLCVSFGFFDSPKLRSIKFLGSDTSIMHSCNMRRAVNIEKIFVPKGSFDFYNRQLGYKDQMVEYDIDTGMSVGR